MVREVKKIIKVKTFSPGDEMDVCMKIHNQLAGNEDYVENRIVLNMSGDRKNMNPDTFNPEEENEVHVYFFNDCKTNPLITI